jgi:hypothetical protein
MDEREELQKRAAQCREMARSATDRVTAGDLAGLAEEFEAEARALAEAKRAPPR